MYTEDREIWHNIYIHELKDMFDIIITNVLRQYPNTQFKVDKAFHNFSRLIFHCSSKILSSYTKSSLKL